MLGQVTDRAVPIHEERPGAAERPADYSPPPGMTWMAASSAELVVRFQRIESIGFSSQESDIVVAALRCLKRTCFRLLRFRCAIGLLLAELLVEGLAPVFVDVVQPPCE